MKKETGINFFEKYLTVWVIICMIGGVLIGKYLPQIPAALGKLEYANISMPIAVLIWLIIYPMMLKIDFKSIVDATLAWAESFAPRSTTCPTSSSSFKL